MNFDKETIRIIQLQLDTVREQIKQLRAELDKQKKYVLEMPDSTTEIAYEFEVSRCQE